MNYPVYIIADQEYQPVELPEVADSDFADRLYYRKEGNTLLFRNIDQARSYLRMLGFSDEEIESFHFLRSIGNCSRCGGYLYKSMSGDYDSQCFGCEEDFYSFEQNNMHDDAFSKLPEFGIATVQSFVEGDYVFLSAKDSEPIVLTKVYSENESLYDAFEEGYTTTTEYLGDNWRIYKNADGSIPLYAAVPRTTVFRK